jgi:putative transposase
VKHQTIETVSKQCQHLGLASLCGWFGMSRQAYYQHQKKAASDFIQAEKVIEQVKSIRQLHPSMGGRKVYLKLQTFMQAQGIKLGRDGLFRLLSDHNLLIRKRKRRIQTTQSLHRFKKYPNQIKEFVRTGPNQLWVSDITYWPLEEEHSYISLITDAYSHKIVGYQLGKSLEAKESITALRMALCGLSGLERHADLLHHSDRGIQYCSNEYIKLLESYKLGISMTTNGDPLENAIAERANGIIKEEYLNHYQVKTFEEAKLLVAKVVKLYNEDRPHMSIGNYTPDKIHESKGDIKTKKLWKNYYQEKLALVNLLQD